VFDVFAFLAECFTDGLRRAVGSRGDGSLRDLRSRDSEGPISLELTYREGYVGSKRPAAITYHLEIDEEHNRPVVAREWMHWKRQSELLRIKRINGCFGGPPLQVPFGIGYNPSSIEDLMLEAEEHGIVAINQARSSRLNTFFNRIRPSRLFRRSDHFLRSGPCSCHLP
jgi:hypothetical protein